MPFNGTTYRRTPLLLNANVLRETTFEFREISKSTCRPEIRAVIPDPVSVDTLKRKARGVRSCVTGETVYLEVAYNNRQVMVSSTEAWMRFVDRLNGAIPNRGPTFTPPAAKETPDA